MTVKELIMLLQTYPSNLQVAYTCCSEQVVLQAKEIQIMNLCHPRPDGWVQNERPDMPTEQYVLFPGN
jgi:hypothetical protein